MVEDITVFIKELKVTRGSVECNMKTVNATAQGIRHIIIGSIGIRVEVYRRVPIQMVDREGHIVCIINGIKGIVSTCEMFVNLIASGNRSYSNRKILTSRRIRAEKNEGVDLDVCNVIFISRRDCYLCYQTNRPFPYTRLNTNNVTNEIPVRIMTGDMVPHILTSAQLRPVEVHSLSWGKSMIERQRYNRKGFKIPNLPPIPILTQLAVGLRKIHMIGRQKCFGKN